MQAAYDFWDAWMPKVHQRYDDYTQSVGVLELVAPIMFHTPEGDAPSDPFGLPPKGADQRSGRGAFLKPGGWRSSGAGAFAANF